MPTIHPAGVVGLESDPLTLDSDALPPIYVSRRLGEGRFGDVLLGEMPSGDQVAIKVALRPTSELSREAAVLSALHEQSGFPRVHGFPRLLHHQTASSIADSSSSSSSDGFTLRSELIVMDLLGPSVQQLFDRRSDKSTGLPSSLVMRIGRGVLRCLRALKAMVQ